MGRSGFRVEGTEAGDCEDNADNDADGLFDCNDPGCAGSSICTAGGTGGAGGIGGEAGSGGVCGAGGMGGRGGSATPVAADAEWNLTCPSDSAVDCGSWASETCLGDVGQRSIIGEHGQLSCTGDPIVAICEGVRQLDGTSILTLEADVGEKFAFKVWSVGVETDTIVGQTACNVTIVEDQVAYDLGTCGEGAPSLEQPCQISNVSVDSDQLTFGLECNSILSSTTAMGLDVGAVGGGPTTIRFSNCEGL